MSDHLPSERRTPTFLLLLAGCLLVDFGLRVAIVRSHVFWFKSPLIPWYIGTLIGQFGIFSAIRLRYPSRRWFAYAGMLMVTAMGYIATDVIDILRLSDRPLLVYLLAMTLLAMLCIFPGSLYQKRFHFPSDYTQFGIKHLLIVIVLIANVSATFFVLPQLVFLTTMVFLIALPTILMSFVLSVTDTIHNYMTWVIILLGLVIFSFTLNLNGSTGDYAALALSAVQLASIGLGGIYLLIYPREAIAANTIDPISRENIPEKGLHENE